MLAHLKKSHHIKIIASILLQDININILYFLPKKNNWNKYVTTEKMCQYQQSSVCEAR